MTGVIFASAMLRFPVCLCSIPFAAAALRRAVLLPCLEIAPTGLRVPTTRGILPADTLLGGLRGASSSPVALRATADGGSVTLRGLRSPISASIVLPPHRRQPLAPRESEFDGAEGGAVDAVGVPGAGVGDGAGDGPTLGVRDPSAAPASVFVLETPICFRAWSLAPASSFAADMRRALVLTTSPITLYSRRLPELPRGPHKAIPVVIPAKHFSRSTCSLLPS